MDATDLLRSAHAIVQQKAAEDAASAPATSEKPKDDDPDTGRSRLIRWLALLASGAADGYSTNKALSENPAAREGGIIAKHFIHGPGPGTYAYTLGSKAIIAALMDLAARHKKTDANVSAGIYSAGTLPAIIGNLAIAKQGRDRAKDGGQ